MDPDLLRKRSRSQSPKTKVRKARRLPGYGIGVAGLSDDTTLGTFNAWEHTYNCSAIYYPVFRTSHRNLILFLYDDEQIRDFYYKLQSKDFAREKRKGLMKIKFEILIAENPNILVEEYFENIRKKITCYKKKILDIEDRRNRTGKLLKKEENQAKMAVITEIVNESLVFLGKCYKKYKSVSTAMNGSLAPSIDTLIWHVICEFIILNTKIPVLKEIILYAGEFSLYERFIALGYSNFKAKLILHEYNLQAFVCHVFWQLFIFKFKKNTVELSKYCYFDILDSSSPQTLSPLIQDINFKRYRKILKSDRIVKVFDPFLQGKKKIQDLISIMGNVYLIPLPRQIHGMDTFTRIIIINSKGFTDNELVICGYRLIILLRALVHYLVRKDCKSSQAILEYESDSTTFIESIATKTKKKCKAKSRKQVEKKLFGQKIKNLNELAAKFVMNPQNWNKKTFNAEFQHLNKQKKYPDGSLIPSANMKNANTKEGVVDFSGNWCGTFAPWWIR